MMRRRINLIDALALALLAGVLPLGFYAHGLLAGSSDPQVKDVEPTVVRSGQDGHMRINGLRFDRWSRVYIDEQPLPAVRFLSPQQLEVGLPPDLALGPHDVQVVDYRQRAGVLRRAFVVRPREVAPVAVAPAAAAMEPGPLRAAPLPHASIAPPPPVMLPLERTISWQPGSDEPVTIRIQVLLLEMERALIDRLVRASESKAHGEPRVLGVLSWGSMPTEGPAKTAQLLGAPRDRPQLPVRSRGTVWALLEVELIGRIDPSHQPARFTYGAWDLNVGTYLKLTLQDSTLAGIITGIPKITRRGPPRMVKHATP